MKTTLNILLALLIAYSCVACGFAKPTRRSNSYTYTCVSRSNEFAPSHLKGTVTTTCTVPYADTKY